MPAAKGSSPHRKAAHAIHGVFERPPTRTRQDASGPFFKLSSHGHFDLGAYDAHRAGKLEAIALAEEEIERALKAIDAPPKPAAGVR